MDRGHRFNFELTTMAARKNGVDLACLLFQRVPGGE